MKTVIIDYKAGNVQSLLFAIERLGFSAKLTSNPDEISSADKVIFPGVGEASFAMNSLRETQLDLLIPKLKQPLLGICLGMQLLCKDSEEGDTKALGIFDVSVTKFPDSVLAPQIGWNQIYDLKSDLFKGIQEQTYTYLVHSYYVAKNKNTIATTDYSEAYSTALQEDNFFGVQFHPEKSGILGSKILDNFLKL
ncbi:imidazole glycerol phosphate synthase subunit HisH [Epilithonimonas zeae]|uniref:Imidazole glycerol phosphate synthase subunit HisH n=1 Tax=Epilithonimonas zeae TaxID=1416779 RepID=A0A1N6JPP8_9FLAO|nr:imidazole glycerol phosphate synthase subunit HisH [Epilithonimonas zeae]SIO46213.1 glutamine amidotransferase [Epilithonimonas zeae]